MRAGTIKDKTQRESLIRAADNRMLASIAKIQAAKSDHPMNIKQAKLILAKVKLENAGLLNKSAFQPHNPNTTQGDIDTATRAELTMGSGSTPPWIAHVKAYQAKHGCSYREALTMASSSYKKTGSGAIAKRIKKKKDDAVVAIGEKVYRHIIKPHVVDPFLKRNKVGKK